MIKLITQAAVRLKSKTAFLFCRQNAIYISYAVNNAPSEPMVMQGDVYPGFNICPEKDGYLIFFKQSSGGGNVIRLTDGGISRPVLDKTILNVSTGSTFIFNADKNTILYSSSDGYIHSLTSRKPILAMGNAAYLKTMFLGGKSYILYEKNGVLYLYITESGASYELYKNAESLFDFSLCQTGRTVHIALLVKNGASFEVLYQAISPDGASGSNAIIKTSSAQNVFVFPYNGGARVFVSGESGKVFYRTTESGKISFTPLENMELKSTAKMRYFMPYNSQDAFSDALCLKDGTIIMPSAPKADIKNRTQRQTRNTEDFYKKSMAEKDRIISQLNQRLNQLQMSSNQTIADLRESLKFQEEQNTNLLNSLSKTQYSQEENSLIQQDTPQEALQENVNLPSVYLANTQNDLSQEE